MVDSAGLLNGLSHGAVSSVIRNFRYNQDRELGLLFTRTIRRKMVIGVSLILVMLFTLALGGISGLSSYRSVVRDLDFSINRSPSRAELAAAIAMLLEPLQRPAAVNSEAVRFQQEEIYNHLEQAKSALLDFRRKLENLPPVQKASALRAVTDAILADIDLGLAQLEQDRYLLSDANRRQEAVQRMKVAIGHLQSLAAVQLPNYQQGLNTTLRNARSVYRSRFQLVGWTSLVVVILFVGLLRYGYVGIFAPLRKLHQGARRVAQGDFDFRLDLTTNDEMAELADAFNQMTTRFQEIAHDLDQQVRTRSRQLVRSKRLAGVGFLAAGVAHEINNPLQAIMAASESLENRSEDFLKNARPEDAQIVCQYLGMIQRESIRCREITAKLLDFARGQDASRSRHDITALISEVLGLVGHLSKFRDRQITFARSFPAYLDVNGPEIKQVILNLVSNALDAMASSGTLRIDIVEQTDQLVIQFEDDGCGMTPDVIDNLFEPFFTQKQLGKGTGLGLSISHRIISDHGGTIVASSAGPGCGSKFSVRFPRHAISREAA